MKVFIAGATGVLGRRLVERFSTRGHSVVGIARDGVGEAVVRSRGGEPVRADLFDVDSLARAASGADVVIHAATAIPVRVRTSRRDWAANDAIRREGTRALVAAARAVKARAYVQQSVVWAVHGPPGVPFDEGAAAASDPRVASALDGERIVQDAAGRHGFEAVVLRCGTFYAPDAAHTRLMGEALARRRPTIIGAGRNVWSFVHADDAASAFVAASETPLAGVWHVVDDAPAPFGQFMTAFATFLEAPPPRRIPMWIARLVLGRDAVRFLSSSFATTNGRFRGAIDWRPEFPTYREGLAQVVRAWRAEGFPARRS